MKRFLKKAMSVVLCGAMLSAALLSTQCLALGYDYTPSLNDTYDDETAVYSWKPQWSPDTKYVDETGRGKVNAVTFAQKAATVETNIGFSGFEQYMAGDINYISFDIKMPTLMNMSFSPYTSGWAYPYSVYISKNGFIAALNFAPTQYIDTPKVIYDCASYNTLCSWGYKSCAPFEANTWYNIKFVLDKTNSVVKIYINDALLGKQSSDVVADLTKMLIRNCSDITDTSSPHMYIDDFKIGTATEYIDVESTAISSDGNASIKFSDPVDTETLTSDNVKILENGKSVSYTGTYDAANNTYKCALDSYKPFSYYTITVNNVKSETGVSCKEYSNTIAGADYVYTPQVTQTYDDDTNTFGHLKQQYASEGSVTTEDTAHGKVWSFPTISKPATTPNMVFSDNILNILGTASTGYISFDIKLSNAFNLAFWLNNNSGTIYNSGMVISKNGFATVIPYGLEGGSGYTGTTKTIMDGTAEAAQTSGYNTTDFKTNTWYNVRLVADKRNSTISYYIDDVLIGRTDGISISEIKNMVIGDCSENTAGTIYVDNMTVGTAQDSMLKITDADGNAVTEFTSGQKLYIDAGIKNNTASDINVQAALAAYDANDCMIGITVHETTVSSGDSVSISKEDMPELNLSGAKTVKAFLWSDWNTLKPFCGCVSASLKAN